MKTKPGKRVVPARIAFWDTSGIVPLCCFQARSAPARRASRTYSRPVVWWGTLIEAQSALARLKREGVLGAREVENALARLEALRARWSEMLPTEEVRESAGRILARHPLRAADALQLAAALVWCEDRPRGRYFVCGDGALAQAAADEGFTVVKL
ncbi:MAG: PIN domain-containing protein [Acidobacteria bacterium]|nr:PIN domain-containing protein [Acidobacteriota bacterium]